jgi:hypothetical protein
MSTPLDPDKPNRIFTLKDLDALQQSSPPLEPYRGPRGNIHTLADLPQPASNNGLGSVGDSIGAIRRENEVLKETVEVMALANREMKRMSAMLDELSQKNREVYEEVFADLSATGEKIDQITQGQGAVSQDLKDSADQLLLLLDKEQPWYSKPYGWVKKNFFLAISWTKDLVSTIFCCFTSKSHAPPSQIKK